MRPSMGHQHGVSIQSLINLGKTCFRISRIWIIGQTWFLARLCIFNFSHFPDSGLSVLTAWFSCIFIFDGVTVKTQKSDLQREGGWGYGFKRGQWGCARRMGSHFHHCFDYNGVAFSIRVTRIGLHIFGFFWVRKF